jgi:hypothetical protein
MKSFKTILVYGLLSWFIPLVVSLGVFPFHDTNRSLFESVMAVAVASTAAWLAALYFSRQQARSVIEGFIIGLIWLVMNVAFDYVVLIRGFGQMAMTEYVYDIGVTYLLFLIIVPAVAHAAKSAKTE